MPSARRACDYVVAKNRLAVVMRCIASGWRRLPDASVIGKLVATNQIR